jgi:hypothetical protein
MMVLSIVLLASLPHLATFAFDPRYSFAGWVPSQVSSVPSATVVTVPDVMNLVLRMLA